MKQRIATAILLTFGGSLLDVLPRKLTAGYPKFPCLKGPVTGFPRSIILGPKKAVSELGGVTLEPSNCSPGMTVLDLFSPRWLGFDDFIIWVFPKIGVPKMDGL